MNENLKRHIISAGITFTSVFLSVLGVSIGAIDTTAALTSSTFAGLFMVAARAAIKAVIERLIAQKI